MDFYKARCKKQIFWNDKTYKAGDPIIVEYAEMQKLSDADVISGVEKIQDRECAAVQPPENAMRKPPRKRRVKK